MFNWTSKNELIDFDDDNNDDNKAIDFNDDNDLIHEFTSFNFLIHFDWLSFLRVWDHMIHNLTEASNLLKLIF